MNRANYIWALTLLRSYLFCKNGEATLHTACMQVHKYQRCELNASGDVCVCVSICIFDKKAERINIDVNKCKIYE